MNEIGIDCVDDQLHSSSLGRFLVDPLAPALVYLVGDFPHVALGEFALASEFVHHFERFDFLLDGLSCDLTPVDFRMLVHALFEVVVNVDRDSWYIQNYVSTEYCVFQCV